MKSVRRIGSQPASLPLLSDDIVEFHAARLLLLMHFCGVRGRIDGLTKMAKLDFFVRYPEFFAHARARELDELVEVATSGQHDAVESAMVRHHYGPWDKRYYHLLAFLEATGLINVRKSGMTYQISLTDLGVTKSQSLAKLQSYSNLVVTMKEVKKTFGRKSGSYLKNLIYKLFDEEVGQRPMGEEIVQ